jgi:hypothetical protein
MRSLEEIAKDNDQPKPEEEPKPDTYLDKAKIIYKALHYNSTPPAQSAQTAALIFIGEQLERIANALEYRL